MDFTTLDCISSSPPTATSTSHPSEFIPLPSSATLSNHPVVIRSNDGTRRIETFSYYKLFSSIKHPLMALYSHITSTNLPSTPSRFFPKQWTLLIGSKLWEKSSLLFKQTKHGLLVHGLLTKMLSPINGFLKWSKRLTVPMIDSKHD